MNTNAIWAAYWILALHLDRPEGFSTLTAEIDASREAYLIAHPSLSKQTLLTDSDAIFDWLFNAGPSMPLLTSTIQETLRYATSTASSRMVMEDTMLGGYALRAGQQVVCLTRAVHLDEELHENPNVFDPTRYMDQSKVRVKDGRNIPNHTIPFGGGVSMCEGRYVANAFAGTSMTKSSLSSVTLSWLS
jgi:cytochrome P450